MQRRHLLSCITLLAEHRHAVDKNAPVQKCWFYRQQQFCLSLAFIYNLLENYQHPHCWLSWAFCCACPFAVITNALWILGIMECCCLLPGRYRGAGFGRVWKWLQLCLGVFTSEIQILLLKAQQKWRSASELRVFTFSLLSVRRNRVSFTLQNKY